MGRNDHVIMFILHLPLVVFSVSVKLGSFALTSKVRIIFAPFLSTYLLFQGDINVNLMFKNLSSLSMLCILYCGRVF